MLDAQPLCLRCLAEGRTRPAVDVHHTTPHLCDPVVFWASELEGLCKAHHSELTNAGG